MIFFDSHKDMFDIAPHELPNILISVTEFHSICGDDSEEKPNLFQMTDSDV